MQPVIRHARQVCLVLGRGRPGSGDRDLGPASRNSVAIACPIPLVPPVIRAVVPVKSKLTRAVMSCSLSDA
ncbi:hypothetical protein BZL30_3674 [Mycobacterium kansasii]|uniref:Uncharacterized protein n=1 Tax=Mycobacterium kansasii TaxID=1768 RepID=A0A1V3X923_MYCKA|nr:hypothetical protein BZL30_3674 [Mycobacterium kansasii]